MDCSRSMRFRGSSRPNVAVRKEPNLYPDGLLMDYSFVGMKRALEKLLKMRGLLGTLKIGGGSSAHSLHRASLGRANPSGHGIRPAIRAIGRGNRRQVIVGDLQIDSPNWIHGTRYEPSVPETFNQAV
jgi:hypothetical protein